MMVSIAAQQVKSNSSRTDEELRDDLAGDPEAWSSLLSTHELALELLRTRFEPDPLTPQVEAQLRRKIAVMQRLLDDAGSS